MSEAMEKMRRFSARRWEPLALPPAQTALLVVDMQRYFLRADSPLGRFLNHQEPGYTDCLLGRVEETVVPNLRRLLLAHRGAGSTVLWTRLASQQPDGSDLSAANRGLNQRAAAAGFPGAVPWVEDPWAGFLPDLGPEPGELLVDKTTYGSFASTNLEQTLRELGVQTLVLCGVVTNVCVETSAREAVDRGLTAIMVADACAAFSSEVQEGNLFAFQTIFGRVWSTGEVVAHLQG